MESDTMILLLITILLIAVVIYNQFIGNEKKINRCDKEEFKNNNKRLTVITDAIGDNTIKKKDLNKYNKIYRKNICLDKKKNKYKKKIEIVENDINSLDNLLNNNNNDMKSLNNIDNNTLSDIESFVI
jgi:hypothetical protein